MGEIVLSYGSKEVRLRNPEFGDSQAHSQQRVLRKSRGGDLQVFRESTWSKFDKLKYTITALSEDKAKQLIVFLQDTLGQKITLTDYNGWVWEGFITTPDAGIVEDKPNCGFQTEFEFEGNKVG